MSKKISQLTTTTTLADTDVLPVVTGMTGTPAGKKIAVSNLKTAVNYHTHANQSALDSVSGVNTGDQTLPVKATGAELNTGTDDAKFATAKALTDSDYAKTSDIPSVPVKATGAEVDTGTDDAKFVTAKAMEDSSYAKTTAIPVKASGAEVTTGTDDAKFATAKALADAGVNTRLKSKLISATREMTASSGNVAYTGVGFMPTAIMAIASTGASGAAPATPMSIGFTDSSKIAGNVSSVGVDTFAVEGNYLILLYQGANFQYANVNSFDADGFTLTWTKGSSPTGIAYIRFLCFA